MATKKKDTIDSYVLIMLEDGKQSDRDKSL